MSYGDSAYRMWVSTESFQNFLCNQMQKHVIFSTYVMESVDCARYLGLSISKDLTWNIHIKEILTKTNRTLGFVKEM